MPSHYLNQCRNIINWTPRNKFQWHFDWNSYIFIQENESEDIIWKMTAVLSRPQCVNLWDLPAPHLNRKTILPGVGILFITRSTQRAQSSAMSSLRSKPTPHPTPHPPTTTTTPTPTPPPHHPHKVLPCLVWGALNSPAWHETECNSVPPPPTPPPPPPPPTHPPTHTPTHPTHPPPTHPPPTPTHPPHPPPPHPTPPHDMMFLLSCPTYPEN